MRHNLVLFVFILLVAAAADADGILLKPVTRIAEPIRHVAFDRLEAIARHDGPRPGTRVGATLAGVGAGAGTFMGVLIVLLSTLATGLKPSSSGRTRPESPSSRRHAPNRRGTLPTGRSTTSNAARIESASAGTLAPAPRLAAWR